MNAWFCYSSKGFHEFHRITTSFKKIPYLLLPKFNGKLEPVELHALPVLEGRARWVVVQQHLQLVGAACVVEQGRRELLALLSELLVLYLEKKLLQIEYLLLGTCQFV